MPILFNLRSSYRPQCSLCKEARALQGSELCGDCQNAYDRHLAEHVAGTEPNEQEP